MDKFFSNDVGVPELPQTAPIVYNPYGPPSQDPLMTLGYDLASYLNQILLNNPKQARFKVIVNFLGISIPFCTNRYKKNMEFACEKQAMGRDNDQFLEKHLKGIFKRWQKRWIVVGYNNIFYYEYPEDPGYSIRDNIIFDTDTSFDIIHIGRSSVEALFNLSRRKLKLSFDRTINGIICLSYIVKAISKSPYTKLNRFTSFAPIREGNDCVFFADGVGYYKELYAALNKAEHDIMITDWWLSPEFPLIRPIKGNLATEESRLDFTLKRAAERGVRVHVLIFREFTLGLNTDSDHAETELKAMHENIRVMRHPSKVVFLWSHHEKMCIVDKRKVFMGGLDLCWNRMDGNNHPLFNNNNQTLFPGVDYGNPLRKDIVQGRQYKKSMIEPKDPRMPWHDVAVMLVGKVCNDFVMHFSAYWNHAKETNYDNEQGVIQVKKNTVVQLDENGEYCVQAPNLNRNSNSAGYPQVPASIALASNPLVGFQGFTGDDSYRIVNPNIDNRSNPYQNQNLFEIMKNDFQRQGQYNNTNILNTAYGSVPNSQQNQNPYSIGSPIQQQQQYNNPLILNNEDYGAGQNASNRYGNDSLTQQSEKKHRNPFNIFSSKKQQEIEVDPYQDNHPFRREEMGQDSSRWQNWMKNNPDKIQSDPGNHQILNTVLTAYNNVTNHKKIVKINKFIEDRDEQSRFYLRRSNEIQTFTCKRASETSTWF